MPRAILISLLLIGGCSSDAASEAGAVDGGSSTGTADETGAETTSPAVGSTSDASAGTDAESGDPEPGTGGETSAGSTTGESGDQTTGTTGEDTPLGDPREPGPFSWTGGSHTLDLGLGSNVPLTLYIPDDAGPHPVVVLTHGFQLSPANYASYGEHLASWGFVVVMPEYPGGLFGAPTHAELRDASIGLLDWIESAADDEAQPLLGRADADSIGMTGHSMGGKISFLTAASDTRADAVFGIDAVDSAGGPGSSPGPDYPSVTPELMPTIDVPIVSVGETTNATSDFGQACAPAADNFQRFFEHAGSPALQVEVVGANHMSFLDDPNCGLVCFACPAGSDDPSMTRRLTQGYLVAFFGRTLRGEPGWSPWLTGDPMQADVDAGLVTFATANGF
jgi:chlorophyllase